jgi:hypothetical protein
MGKKERKKRVSDVSYIVQSDVARNEVYNFTERPVLCEVMSTITGGKPWSKDTLDYHFGRKRVTEFSYRGYTIFMRTLQRGRSRGKNTQNIEMS